MALGLDVNGLPSTNTCGLICTGAPGAPGAGGTETTTSWRTIGSRVGGGRGGIRSVGDAAPASTVQYRAPFHERCHVQPCRSADAPAVWLVFPHEPADP